MDSGNTRLEVVSSKQGSEPLKHFTHVHKSLGCKTSGCVVDSLDVNSIWLQYYVLVGGAYLEATIKKRYRRYIS